jgi:hypothetical protein
MHNNRSIAAEKAWVTRRKKQRRLSRAAKKAWKTRLNEWQNLRRSILLIECIPESNIDCSEGEMLSELFRIVNHQMSDNYEKVEWASSRAKSPEQLLKILRKAEQSCIHISCHGQYYENYKKTGLKLEEGRLFSDQICASKDANLPIWNERRIGDDVTAIPQLVFLSACETAYVTDLCERFMQAGVRYVIAPKEETRFSDSAIFSSVFYPLVYVEQKNPYMAFRKIKETFPTMSGKWQFYDFYKHIFKYYDPNGVVRL